MIRTTEEGGGRAVKYLFGLIGRGMLRDNCGLKAQIKFKVRIVQSTD